MFHRPVRSQSILGKEGRNLNNVIVRKQEKSFRLIFLQFVALVGESKI